MKSESKAIFLKVQSEMCTALEAVEATSRFVSDEWDRPDIKGSYGGGGLSRVLTNGSVFEKAGVNFSEVSGHLPIEMSKKLAGADSEAKFYATGVSLIIHPFSPLVPTIHANLRYLEVNEFSWFGGGVDLTPYYLDQEDARNFHQKLKSICDTHNPHFYPDFKKQCDEYFYLPHRKEHRGIGGLFFDYLGKGNLTILQQTFPFIKELGASLPELYLTIVKRHKDREWKQRQKEFQLLRRGRYVEFNLLYDKGTQFGLKTGGRTESILVSMPPEVRWEYNQQISPGSDEAKLLDVLKNPREWL